jgi:hypothetical protein
MKVPSGPWLVALAGVAGLLAAVASAAGVLLRGDLATVPFTTLRGDEVEVLAGGAYRFNGVAIAAEGVGWDLVTLLAVVPALAVALPGLARGSLRATLVVVGILAYLLYQYAEYAMALAYGPLFLVYVSIAGLSASLIGVLVARLDLASISAPSFPRRAVAAFGAFVALLLAGMWLPLVARTATAVSVPELAGGTTLVVQAFDLGFLVPLGILTAVAAWRRLAVAPLLAAILAVKGSAMGAAIAAMLIVEAVVTGLAQPVPIAGFAAISVVSLALAWRVLRSVHGPSPGAATAAPPAGAHHVTGGASA